MGINNCRGSEEQPGNKNEIMEIQKLIKLGFAEETNASQELQLFTLAEEHTVGCFFVVMRLRLRRENKVLYDEIFSPD